MGAHPKTDQQKSIDKNWRKALKTVFKLQPQIADTLTEILDTGDELIYQLRAALRIEALAVLSGIDLSDHSESPEDLVEEAFDRIHRMRLKLAEIIADAELKTIKAAKTGQNDAK